MKYLLYILLLCLMGCSSSMPDEGFIAENKESLLKIFEEALKGDNDRYEVNDGSNISKDLKELGIDILEIKYKSSSMDFINADSLAYFIIKNKGFSDPAVNIVYDFGNTPRNFGNKEIINASYERKQHSQRWYYETIGFD